MFIRSRCVSVLSSLRRNLKLRHHLVTGVPVNTRFRIGLTVGLTCVTTSMRVAENNHRKSEDKLSQERYEAELKRTEFNTRYRIVYVGIPIRFHSDAYGTYQLVVSRYLTHEQHSNAIDDSLKRYGYWPEHASQDT